MASTSAVGLDPAGGAQGEVGVDELGIAGRPVGSSWAKSGDRASVPTRRGEAALAMPWSSDT